MSDSSTQIDDPPPRRSAGAGVIRLLAALILLLPYAWRIRLTARLASALAGKLSRAPAKIEASIAVLRPDMTADQRAAVVVSVLRNSARTQVELLSGEAFHHHAAASMIEGPGLDQIEEAHKTGRPVLLLVSHFGNSAAVASALKARGIVVGTYYKPLADPVINQRYERSLLAFTEPLFTADRTGLSGMQRFLRDGGMVTISFDLDRPGSEALSFLGRPTPTALSIAQIALKRNALMMPVYGVRQEDGLSFKVFLDAAITHGDARKMMQDANDSLSRMVESHPEQWLWWHRRWKGGPPSAHDA
jgi:Kdo2-lipid IVA lauroyltransferase/acyltransferase